MITKSHSSWVGFRQASIETMGLLVVLAVATVPLVAHADGHRDGGFRGHGGEGGRRGGYGGGEGDRGGGWDGGGWGGGYYRPPPVVYGAPYYYPPPLVYGPAIGGNIGGMSIGIQ